MTFDQAMWCFRGCMLALILWLALDPIAFRVVLTVSMIAQLALSIFMGEES